MNGQSEKARYSRGPAAVGKRSSRPHCSVDIRTVTGCIVCLVVSAVIGFLFYRYLCEFHAPVSETASLPAEDYVLLTENADGGLICTVRMNSGAEYVSMRLLIEDGEVSYLSDPLCGSLTFSPSRAADIPVELPRCMLTANGNEGASGEKIVIEALTETLSENATGRLIFSAFGRYLIESDPFYILPWLREDVRWK